MQSLFQSKHLQDDDHDGLMVMLSLFQSKYLQDDDQNMLIGRNKFDPKHCLHVHQNDLAEYALCYFATRFDATLQKDVNPNKLKK